MFYLRITVIAANLVVMIVAPRADEWSNYYYGPGQYEPLCSLDIHATLMFHLFVPLAAR